MRSTSPFATTRWMVAVMLSVVVAFVLAVVARTHFETALESRTSDIITNAMPSVQYLSELRGDLQQLQDDIIRGAPNVDADSARQDATAKIAAYVELPFFASERALFSPVTDALAVLDRDREAYVRAPDPDKLAIVRHDFMIIDRAIERVVSFDAEQGQRLGLEIEHIRAEARVWVMFLDGASLALALVAAGLALRQLRRAVRAHREELTEHERREAELAARNESLGQFAGRVAHDVLSPLGTVMLSLDLVRESCAENRGATGALQRGVAALHRVQMLVDGLLTFARAGGQPEPGDASDVAPLMTEVIGALREDARERQIELRLAPVPTGRAACSEGVLTSLVSNLVRNAIKYMGDTSERRIDVRVSATAERWHVEVSDTGPGIPEDQQTRIFEPYVQIAHGGGGIGLGLATVDRLTRAHGGSVGVRSTPGHGATFWFELPKTTAVGEERRVESTEMQPHPAT